jgi:hypothetical protein
VPNPDCPFISRGPQTSAVSWLTDSQIIDSSSLKNSPDRRGLPGSPTTCLHRRMQVMDETTQRLLREYLEDLLHGTSMYTTQTPSKETLIATLQALANDPLLTHPPPLPPHSRRALLPELPNWHWEQTTTVSNPSMHLKWRRIRPPLCCR